MWVSNTEKKSVKDMIQTMVRAKYDSDPVKAWKEAQKKILVCAVVVIGMIVIEHLCFTLL